MSGLDSERIKRMKFHQEDTSYKSDYWNRKDVVNCSDGFPLNEFLSELDKGKYGSLTKEYESLNPQRTELRNLLSKLSMSSSSDSPRESRGLKSSKAVSTCPQQNQVNQNVRTMDVDLDTNVVQTVNHISEKELRIDVPVINIDSDEEDEESEVKDIVSPPFLESQLTIQVKSTERGTSCEPAPYWNEPASLNTDTAVVVRRPVSLLYEKVQLRVTEKPKPMITNGIEKEQTPLTIQKYVRSRKKESRPRQQKEEQCKNETENLQIMGQRSAAGRDDKESGNVDIEVNGDPEYAQTSVRDDELSPGVETHDENNESGLSEADGLDDLWRDMSLAMECSKGIESDVPVAVQKEVDCDHSYVLQEDFGLVCRVCGIIQKSIETIFDFQWKKAARPVHYTSGSHDSKDVFENYKFSGPRFSEHNLFAADISVHPRHLKQMRPHQLEGFNFLVKNMLSDKPGGCILAHAPGSGKTFLLISFIQSFMAKIEDARPLIILPKGILDTWKKEFQRWQVEDIPIYDFYYSKANSRQQQLAILSSWQKHRSILLLGYKQFSNIVTDDSEMSSRCREILLEVPSLLIMDEGHTPRNQDTHVLQSLEKVLTPRKVVLSGTLFQNHVKEVFNILNLVRPKFLTRESSIVGVRRIMSKVYIPGRRSNGCAERSFYDFVEETLQKDDNYARKVSIIKDLREMTHDVLHYYKGDILDELPGLVDFSVLLNLTPRQKQIVQDLGNLLKFKRAAMENAVYVHPYLKEISDHATADKDSNATDDKIDNILSTIDVLDGVKTKFFLKLLDMSVAAGEKLLVFSRYLVPLKFLEKLVMQRGWTRGNEVFMILGDSSPEQREIAMERFNTSPHAKVFFGSIKACGEGISLVGASRVIILDVHLNPSVTRQAIGRAFRPGQTKKVYTYRLVAADSSEEADHASAFTKELLSKMWFEWSEYCDQDSFELEEVKLAESQDSMLEHSGLGAAIKALYRR